MKVLILAAGQGERLETLTDDVPKALVKVLGRELIRCQLDFLEDPSVTKIGVVGGYHAALVRNFLSKNNLPVDFFENTRFEQGSILTLKAALDFLDDDFLMMNVDHIYPKRLLNKVVKQAKGITAVCDFDRPLVEDDMKVKLDDHRHLFQIHKKLPQYDGGYIGMTYCPADKIALYKQAMETTLVKLGEKTSVEMILGELATRGEPVHIADTSGIRWLEVDTIEDLQKAEKALKSHPQFLA
ncbi:MAG: NTP transferase domain-containing protein [Deltaproteobacteria bacterium]|nr:NTP transferase domain-containing protein [Deltaproteobacteria bacterium]